MRIFEIENIKQAKEEMELIGADTAGIEIMAPKSVFKTIKITGLSPIACNIIKQEMLSAGGEAAAPKGAVNLSQKNCDLMIMGTLAQLGALAQKLLIHQFNLPEISKNISASLKKYFKPPLNIQFKKKKLGFGKRTYIMGILNATPDSFSDGGKFLNFETALAQADKMISEGADIIDVGGESTRPGAENIPETAEIKRILPIIKELKKRRVIISIDTRKAKVAEAAISEGADMINDISALRFDKNMAHIAAAAKVPVVLMHMKGTPKNMQNKPEYHDLMAEIIDYLDKSIKIAENAGVNNIIIDPGFGFSKTAEHNIEILSRLKELKVFGLPILIGTSRKSTIGEVLDLPVEDRLEGTLATVVVAILNGADIIRVHDIKCMKRAAKMADAIARRTVI
ncbi:MAG: dihydropteroate synthase [Candidatus Saganbacteria bacterium]|uniref:Dihydropteroate synthase n=1 Tax=Candidatus Saganbacteria bacterium TaxID=2575572 RepID=A0A833L0C2_UNCSA|nr:MAG: dihydropteroate synthase [Candidatus Saganbacteria bacterium]